MAAERIIDAFDALRAASALSREPSHELLLQFDAALLLANAALSELAAAALPGTALMVGGYLGELLDCYGSGQGDATTFGRLLILDVLELKPPIGAVETACRRWRQRREFAPRISEMLEAVRSEKSRIEKAVEFMDTLQAERNRLARDLGNA